MTLEQKEILRKKRVLEYAEACRDFLKACRHFGVSRSNFYVWRTAYRRQGDAGLRRKKPIARSHPNQTSAEIVKKVLYVMQKYHRGPIRIVWYLRRYHDIKLSDAGVYRILRRNGLSGLPRKANRRAVQPSDTRNRSRAITSRPTSSS
jgi:transposase